MFVSYYFNETGLLNNKVQISYHRQTDRRTGAEGMSMDYE